MKASELKAFDLSEMTIKRERLSGEGLNKLISRITKYKKPHYIRAVEKNKRNDKYIKVLNDANKYAEPSKQQEVISKYLND